MPKMLTNVKLYIKQKDSWLLMCKKQKTNLPGWFFSLSDSDIDYT
jgi:hypothetical protein